jgi:uncharacterized membrane protein
LEHLLQAETQTCQLQPKFAGGCGWWVMAVVLMMVVVVVMVMLWWQKARQLMCKIDSGAM